MTDSKTRPQRSALQLGTERLDALVSEVRNRQRVFADKDVMRSAVLSPSEVWSKKFLSQGIGPDAPLNKPIACFEDGTCLPPRAQLMMELESRAAGPSRKAQDAIAAPDDFGSAPMRHPFAPERPKRKRSWLGRMFLG